MTPTSPSPLEVFRKFIGFGTLTRPYYVCISHMKFGLIYGQVVKRRMMIKKASWWFYDMKAGGHSGDMIWCMIYNIWYMMWQFKVKKLQGEENITMVSDQIQTSYIRGKSEFYHQNHPHHYQTCSFPVGGEGPGKESEEVVERLPLIKVMLLI